MSRIKLRYVQSFIDRKTGAVFHYFRRPGCPRVRLPGLPGSSEFMRAYEAALETPQIPIGTSLCSCQILATVVPCRAVRERASAIAACIVDACSPPRRSTSQLPFAAPH